MPGLDFGTGIQSGVSEPDPVAPLSGLIVMYEMGVSERVVRLPCASAGLRCGESGLTGDRAARRADVASRRAWEAPSMTFKCCQSGPVLWISGIASVSWMA